MHQEHPQRVHAIAFQTLAKVADKDAVRIGEDRLAARVRSHDALTGKVVSMTTIEGLAKATRATFDPDRFGVEGPEIFIGRRSALASLLTPHELATNAVEDGALSVPDGRVSARWAIGADSDDKQLGLRWDGARRSTCHPADTQGVWIAPDPHGSNRLGRR